MVHLQSFFFSVHSEDCFHLNTDSPHDKIEDVESEMSLKMSSGAWQGWSSWTQAAISGTKVNEQTPRRKRKYSCWKQLVIGE